MLNAPVEARPKASSALGACILAAAGTIHADLQSATAAMAVSGEVFQPIPEERDRMEESYLRFLAELTKRGWIPDRR